MTSGSPVQVVGLSVSGLLGLFELGRTFEAAGVCRDSAQPAGLPGEPLAKRSVAWLGLAGKPQRVNLAPADRGELGDVGDREAQAIVTAGANRHRNRDRDIDDRRDEGEAQPFLPRCGTMS